jgi:hypothetical protein
MMRSIPACDQSIDDILGNLQSGQIVRFDGSQSDLFFENKHGELSDQHRLLILL